VWYFAYGSNLNAAAVTEWCRHYAHKTPALRNGRAAVLDNYRLCFPLFSEYWGGGIADIIYDPGKYVADTCAIVPKDVLTSLGFSDAGTFQAKGDTAFTKAGPTCSWRLRGQGIGVLVSLATGSRDAGTGGLAGLYAAHRANTLVKFIERAPDVESYPAVFWGPLDERRMGSCGLGVGIADDLTFDVYAQGYQGPDDSCGAATQVASSIIKTLKGA
jgi:hypothetical protein